VLKKVSEKKCRRNEPTKLCRRKSGEEKCAEKNVAKVVCLKLCQTEHVPKKNVPLEECRNKMF